MNRASTFRAPHPIFHSETKTIHSEDDSYRWENEPCPPARNAPYLYQQINKYYSIA